MNSPKPHKKDKQDRKPQQGRTHTNAKFYSSTAWRGLRKQYLAELSDKQLTIITTEVEIPKQLYLIDKIPICETCLRLFMADAYDTVTKGHELDHIQPINPLNALDSKWFGAPLDKSNLQFLCTRHHAKKSQRERRSNAIQTQHRR